MKFTAVILAAGSSSRFGRNKLLLPYGSSTVLETVVDRLTHPDIRDILIITGPHADDIANTVSGPAIRCVPNEAHQEGMSSSIRVAARNIASDVDGIVISPGDMPAFQTDTVLRLLSHFRPKSIVLPRYLGQKGHPVILDREIFLECLGLGEDRVLQAVIANHQSRIIMVDVEDQGILKDIDTPEDYDALSDRVRPS